jgi:uncharacterized protein YcbX
MAAHVSGLATTPVKSTRIAPVQSIDLDELGARGNRSFCVIDAAGRMLNAKRQAKLQSVCSSYDPETGRLALEFPDGSRVEHTVEYGTELSIRFFSHVSNARLLVGPWAQALSDHIGTPLRLVEPEVGVDRGADGSVSVISRASLAHFAQVAEKESVDPRRFRMLIEIDGVGPYAEDSWIGRTLRIGSAVVSINGNVGRCLVTGLDPETGVRTLPTLDLLGSYRTTVDTTEPLPFGVFGSVVSPGTVSIGDPITVEE